MSKQETSRKPLIIGIVAAVVILVALMGLLLTQCVGGDTTESTPAQTVGYLGEAEPYDLYWNLDRALYDGKSEAGMSSRKPEADGYFHVRFFKDGEILELKVADRKTVNAIEVNDLMGLEFDSDGIVVGVISLDDMPLQQVGWKFYVQSIGGNLLKLNSAKSFDGMELLLEMIDITAIYDMTGAEGEVGKRITPIATDRVIAIANLAGELTHVYIYERSEYMQSFEAECQHCKETVTWKVWNKPDTLPTAAGHYQLSGDIQLKKQQAIEEDALVCLDLNGYAVDGADNARVYTLHNVGANLALMDTSEEQKGVLRGHSKSSPQGGVVWVRYGAFYMYAGTLDGSDMTCVLTGATVQVPKNSYFYMYGGTVKGGTAMYTYNEETKKYGNGLGGAIAVSGKFVMHDGLITGGKAVAAVSEWNKDGTPKTYQRGIGGNIYVAGGGEFEMKGGKIQNGVAGHSGGNVYLDGASTMIMDGGMITGGSVAGKGRNGGNVFVTSKATLEMNGGSINWGTTHNCGGNLYFNGTVKMNGGYIGNGVVRDWATGKKKPADKTTNVFQVGGKMIMYGGIIEGGYTITDTSATDKTITTLILGGIPVISADEGKEYDDLTLTNGGSGVKVIVGTMVKGSKIGVHATTGIFTQPTSEVNTQYFYSNIEEADIHYVSGCIALGRWNCVCGEQKHFGACNGDQLFWAPIVAPMNKSLPGAAGNYYLAKDVTITTQAQVAENAHVNLDLNGHILTGPNNHRTLGTFNPGSSLTITDISANKTGTIKTRGAGPTQGAAVWVRYGTLNLYSGILDGSDYTLYTNWGAGTDKVFGTSDDKTEARDGGTVAMSTGTTFNMYGGTIIGAKAEATTMEKTVTEGEGDAAVKKTITRDMVSANGGALAISKNCTFNMYNGVIRDGKTHAKGGNIVMTSTGGVANLYGGTISGGLAGMFDEAGKLVTYVDANGKTQKKSAGWGGNIDMNDSSTVNLLGTVITGGKSGGNGGNIRVGNAKATLNMSAGKLTGGESTDDQGGNIFISGTASITGGSITDGKAKNGGNIGVNTPKTVTLKNITVSGGIASNLGGNIRVSSTNKECTLNIGDGTVITGGSAKTGGNLSIESNNANKNDPVIIVNISGGKIEKGAAKESGGNIYLTTGAKATISGGTIADGTAVGVEKAGAYGGNIYMTKTAQLTVSGGEITGGKSGGELRNGWGGNIDINDSAVVNITGGTIAEGVAGGNGGNIRLGSKASTLNMTGGTVTGGQSTKDQGGNMFLSGVANLSGGTVSGGKARNGGNIGVNSAVTVTFDGVTITGGTAEDRGGNVRMSTTNKTGELIIAEGTVITGGSAKTGGNLCVEINNYNKNDPIATLKITGGTIENGIANGDLGGNVYIGSSSTMEMTGGLITGGKSAIAAGGGKGGNLYISGADVTISGGTLQNGEAGSLAEDGRSIDFGPSGADGDKKGWGGNISMKAGSLTLTGEAKILGGAAGRNGGSIHVEGGALNISGGTVSGGLSHWDQGGNIWMGSGTTLNVTGGDITDGVAAKNGGNIHCNANVTVLLDKVTVSGGSAYGSETYKSANVNIGGGTDITIASANIAGYVNVGAGVKLSGKPVINAGATNLSLNGNDLNIENLDAGTDEGKVGITDDGAGIFTGAAQRGEEKYFFSDDAAKVVGFVNGKLSLDEGRLGMGRYRCLCGKPKGYEGDHAPGCDGDTGRFWAAWTSTTSLPTENGNWYLTAEEIKFSGQFVLEKDAQIAIDLNGCTVTDTDNRMLTTSHNNSTGNVTLWITDTSEKKDGVLKVTDPSYDNKGVLLWLDTNSTLNLLAGTLDAYAVGKATTGAAIHIATASTLNMYGGQIIGGAASTGGAVQVSSGCTFTLYGGTVTGGKATEGGAVYTAGTLNISGGTITGGEATSGGAIYTTGALNLTSGTVENGTATNGGNIYLLGGMEMTGGLVTGGRAIHNGKDGANGGNIYIAEEGDLDISGGMVSLGKAGRLAADGVTMEYGTDSNTKVGMGGNILITGNANLRISGTAEISEGTCGRNGGNVYIGDSNATVTMTGGTVTKGQSKVDQGGNLFTSGTLTISGGTVSEGTAPNGGNIGINGNKTVTIGGNARIIDGVATGEGGNIRMNSTMSSKCELVIEGNALISGGQARNGGNIALNLIAADDVGTLLMTGGTVTEGKAVHSNGGYGGNIYLVGADVTISGGTVSLGKAGILSADGTAVEFGPNYDGKKGWGGSIYVENRSENRGTLTITGTATVSGGKSGGNGGNIYNKGDVTVSGGTLTGGETCYDNGGNIWNAAGASLAVSNGSITNGIAGNNAGNIHANGGVTVSLTGGNITGGKAKNSTQSATANVYLAATSGKPSQITLGSATIGGYVTISNGNNITLTGAPVITGAATGKNNLTIGTNNLTLKDLTEGANVGITADEGPFTVANDNADAYLTYFSSDNASYEVGVANKQLILGKTYCLCGDADGHADTSATTGCNGQVRFWQPWSSTTALPTATGNYYLTGAKVKTSGQVTVPADQKIAIDLNGKTVETSTNRGFWLRYANSTVTITDTAGNGTIKNTAKHDQGGMFWIAAANTQVHLIKGTLDASGFSNRGYNAVGGAAVVVANATAKFYMYDGELKANKDATANIPAQGAAVAVASSGGTFELHGGTIYGGKVQYQVWDDHGTNRKSGLSGGIGGAVYICSGGTMTMTGGEIVGGTAIAATATDTYTTTNTKTDGGLGGAVYVGGTLTMSGGKISGGSTVSATDANGKVVGGLGDNVYVAGTLTMNGGEIVGGVDASAATGAVTVSGNAKISGGSANLILGAKELTVGTLTTGAQFGITADEGAFTGTGRTNADLAYFTSDNADMAVTYYGGRLYMGKFACICGKTGTHLNYTDPNGNFVGCDGTKVAWTPWTSANSLPTATGNYYLTNKVNLTNGQTNIAEGANVVLDLNGYTVTSNNGGTTNNSDYRIFALSKANATLTITDTYVVPANNTDTTRTGGKLVKGPMRNDRGCVVWVNNASSKAVLLGGTLDGDKSQTTQAGPVVRVQTGGKFYMLGGTITGGKTTSSAGNIGIDENCAMYMTGGTVSDGQSATEGGNIAVYGGANLVITGGTITGGKAKTGANIHVVGTMSAKNATISYGDARFDAVEGNGGNINVSGVATLEDCNVSYGDAKNGGNLHINDNGELYITGGTVTNGTATNGTAMQMRGKLEMNGGYVDGSVNVLTWNRASGASVTLSGNAHISAIHFTKGLDSGAPAGLTIEDIALPNLTITGALSNTATVNGAQITLSPMKITTKDEVDHLFAITDVEANAARFATDYEGKSINYFADMGGLYMGKYHCLCGGNGNTDTTNGGTCVGATEGCDSILRLWTATTSRPDTTGNYYLTDDITLTETPASILTAQDIAIDLNGHDITTKQATSSSGRIYNTNTAPAANKINFIFTNTSDEASAFVLDDSDRPDGYGCDQGTVVWAVGGTTTVTVYNVNVDMTKALGDAGVTYPGTAFAAGNNATLKIYNSRIFGATNTNGAAIAMSSSAKVHLHDTAITGNKWGLHSNTGNANSLITLSGTAYISGNTEKDIIFNSNSKAIVLAEGYTGTAGKVSGIHSSKVGDVFIAATGELTYAHKDLFQTRDNTVLGFSDGKLQIHAAGSHVHCVCAGTLGNAQNGYVYDIPDSDADHVCVDIVYTKASEVEALTTSGTYSLGESLALYLDESITLGDQVWTNGFNLDLCLNGGVLTGAKNRRMLSTNGGGTITVTTCDAGYVEGNTTKNVIKPVGNDNQQGGGGLWVTGGTAHFYRGTIDASGNTGSQSQHGMAVRLDEATLYQYPGTTIIGGYATKNSGDTAYAHGGSVYLGTAASRYYMLGGTIKNGKAQWAGNIYIMKGIFTMYDGLVTGGIYKPAGATEENPDAKYSNIGIRTGTLDVRGGLINGRIGNCNTDVGNVLISGSAKIYAEKNAETNAETSKNLTVTNQTITVGSLNNDTLVYLTDVTASTVLSVKDGAQLDATKIASQIIAPGYTAVLSADGKTITFTANP